MKNPSKTSIHLKSDTDLKHSARSPLKERLDKILVDRGFAKSRERAKSLILSGNVYVNDRMIDKAGAEVQADSAIRLKKEDIGYVSRGGLKLEKALSEFAVNPQNLVCLDIGASTGGFTDCLLQHGARRVYAVDVGYGQLAWSIRSDERVVVIDRTNFREIPPSKIPEKIDLVSIDVSFISVRKIIPNLLQFLSVPSNVIILIKPQFEGERGDIPKGGVIKDDDKRQEIVDGTVQFLMNFFNVGAVIESPIKGASGNVEFLAFCSYPKKGDK